MTIRSSNALFTATNDTTLRMVLLEHEGDQSTVTEICEFDITDPRNATISVLMHAIEESGLDLENPYQACWPVDLGRAKITRSQIGKIIDAFPGLSACGEIRDIS
jgi:hypothetical protein